MALYRIVDLYAATDYAQLCGREGLLLAPNEVAATVIRGDQALLRWRLYQRQSEQAAFAIPNRAGLEFVITNRYQCTSTAGILVYSPDAAHSPAYWSDANRNTGRVACLIDTNTTPLAASLSTSASVTYYAALIMTPPGTDEHVTLCQFDFTITNDVWRIGQAATVPIVLYPPMTQSSSSSSSSSTVNLSTSSPSTFSSSSSSSSSTEAETTSQSSTSAGASTSSVIRGSSSSSSSSTLAEVLSTSSTAGLSTSSQSSASTAAMSTSSPSSASTAAMSTSSQSSASSSSTAGLSTSSASTSSGGVYCDLLISSCGLYPAYNGTYTYAGLDGFGNPYWQRGGATLQYSAGLWTVWGFGDWYQKSVADPPADGSWLGTYTWRFGGDDCTVANA